MDAGTLKAWMRRQIGIERDTGRVIRLELRHMPSGSKRGEEVDGVDVPAQPDDDWYDATAALFLNRADSDGREISGVQTYIIAAYREREPKAIASRCTHRVRGDDYDTDGEGDIASEPASVKGVCAQLMRHNEALARTLAAVYQAHSVHSSRTIARLSEQNERLQQQRSDNIALVEDLQTQKLERELAAKREENRAEALKGVVEELKLLGPAIVNRVAGKEIVPQKEDPKALMLKRFVESLTDKQRSDLLGSLTQQQQIALGELFQALN